jgi:hypothetical protein
MEDPGGVEPLGARIKSPLPNHLGLKRSGSISHRDAAASRPGLLIVVVMVVSCCCFFCTVSIRGLVVHWRGWCTREDLNLHAFLGRPLLRRLRLRFATSASLLPLRRIECRLFSNRAAQRHWTNGPGKMCDGWCCGGTQTFYPLPRPCLHQALLAPGLARTRPLLALDTGIAAALPWRTQRCCAPKSRDAASNFGRSQCQRARRHWHRSHTRKAHG